jgi:hypothetical protein
MEIAIPAIDEMPPRSPSSKALRRRSSTPTSTAVRALA